MPFYFYWKPRYRAKDPLFSCNYCGAIHELHEEQEELGKPPLKSSKCIACGGRLYRRRDPWDPPALVEMLRRLKE